MTAEPDSAGALLEQGRTHWEAGRPGSAVHCWEAALLAARESSDLLSTAIAHLNLALVLSHRGDHDGVAAELEAAWSALEAAPDGAAAAAVFQQLAARLEDSGEPEAALRYLEAAQRALGARAAPEVAAALRRATAGLELRAGRIALAEQRWRGAVDHLRAAQAMAGGDPAWAFEIPLTLASALVGAGELEAALTAARAALACCPEGSDPTARARLLHDIGALAARGGDLETAIGSLESALAAGRDVLPDSEVRAILLALTELGGRVGPEGDG